MVSVVYNLYNASEIAIKRVTELAGAKGKNLTFHKLPATQLENALSKNPTLKPPLVDHANQPNIRFTLPRSTLVVLGLVSDPQPSGQAQTSQSHAADTASSAADVVTEVTQESADIR